MLGTQVSGSSLKEHAFVKASPDVLRRIDEVLDAAGNTVGPGSGLGMEFGLGMRLGLGE